MSSSEVIEGEIIEDRRSVLSVESAAAIAVIKLVSTFLGYDLSEDQAGWIVGSVRRKVEGWIGSNLEIEDLEDRRGLLLRIPLCLPVEISRGELRIDLSEWEEEIGAAIEDWGEGIEDLAVLTEEGEGEEIEIEPGDLEIVILD